MVIIRYFKSQIWVAVLLAGSCVSAQPVEIGSRLELFVDSLLIGEMVDVELRLHHPVEAEPGPRPAPYGHYATVITHGDLYQLYSRGGGKAAYDGDPVEHTEYFESRDGVNWDRPVLGLYEVDGTKENNVILAHDPPFSHNFSPFLDSRPGVPAHERYKALAGTHDSGLVAFVSGDGISWTKLRAEPVFTDGIFDSQNVSFWSESEGFYVCYFRTWTGEGFNGLRTISRTTSPDFINWSDAVAMNPNEPGEHLYTSATHPYYRAPHIYVALPTRFQPERGNSTDILFMTSRGGDSFSRLFKEAFIRPGLLEAHWHNRANYAALNVVPTGIDEMSIYVRGRRQTLRTDGFVSVHAGFNEGVFTTRPLIFSGSRLVLNVSTSAGGQITVQILDESLNEDRNRNGNGNGKPESIGIRSGNGNGNINESLSAPFIGDATATTVIWPNSGDLSRFSGKPVRLRFVMKEADLYSIQFQP